MQEILRQDKFIRRVGAIRLSLFEPRGIVTIITVLILCIVVLLQIIDPMLGWIAAFILQILLLLSNVFSLVVLMEYQERTGYDAADVERLLNPVRVGDLVLRSSLLLLLYWMGSFIVGTVTAGSFLVYDLFLHKLGRIDSTRLWKEINPRLLESKFKLAGNIMAFFAILGAMVFNLIESW